MLTFCAKLYSHRIIYLSYVIEINGLCMYYSITVVLATKPLQKDLQNLVTPDYASHWRKIGDLLGIKEGILNIIDHDYFHKAEDCCNALWKEWLETDLMASWRKLIQIIDSIGKYQNYMSMVAKLHVYMHKCLSCTM